MKLINRNKKPQVVPSSTPSFPVPSISESSQNAARAWELKTAFPDLPSKAELDSSLASAEPLCFPLDVVPEPEQKPEQKPSFTSSAPAPQIRRVATSWLAGLPEGAVQVEENLWADGQKYYRWHSLYERYEILDKAGRRISVIVELDLSKKAEETEEIPAEYREPEIEVPREPKVFPPGTPRALAIDFDLYPGGVVEYYRNPYSDSDSDFCLSLDGDAVDIKSYLSTVAEEERVIGHAYSPTLLKAVMRRCLKTPDNAY